MRVMALCARVLLGPATASLYADTAATEASTQLAYRYGPRAAGAVQTRMFKHSC